MTEADPRECAPICVIDVGAPKNLGWALLTAGAELPDVENFDGLLALLPHLVRSDGLSLGFEAPMFLPQVDDFRKFTAGRAGEGNRPWSAGAGATVTTIGIALMVHVLGKLRAALPEGRATLDFSSPPQAGSLLVFEAFVSGRAKCTTHHEDAMWAARAYYTMRARSAVTSAVSVERAFSLAGAALLATGWSSDLGLLHTPCLVIRPEAAP